MPRIPLPDEKTMTPEQRRVFESVISGPRGVLIGPLRAALHRPDLAEVWQRFGAMLRYGTSLPAKLSELAIIVTARRWNSQLEWLVHAEAARKAGLSDAVIECLRKGESPAFADSEEADIYEFTRELQMTGEGSEDSYAKVHNRWGPVGVVELTTLVGYYTLVSMTLNAHHIPLPEGETPLLDPCEPAPPATDLRGHLTDIAASAMQPASE